jgi:glycosyltransferase involved in cell wall biosynthesis
MKVLVLHSRYLSGVVSGENQVVEDEVRLLREAGHDVRLWQPSVELQTSGPRMAADVVWSRSATREVRRLVRERRPDLVHVHSLYPRLSPAILHAVPRELPTVLTLHNFRLMCLPASYLRNGSICEDCAGRQPWRGILHACYRDSRPASAALAASLVVHRAFGTFSRVDCFFAVSSFIRDKHIEAGLESNRVRVKSNFAWPTDQRTGSRGPLLFLGRIAPEKGLETIIRALPDALELVVAGDGSERPRLERHVGEKRITFLGQADTSDVPDLLRTACAVVVPSRWYEGQPRVILEAFAAGVPVLASRIGGLPELIEEGVNGHLVDPADERGWRGAMESVADEEQSRRLGNGAFATWQRRFTPRKALRELEEAYGKLIAAAPTSRSVGIS